MTEFASVWDEAGLSAEAAQAERALETAKVATAGLWPFLALAKDQVEFGQRLALAEDRLTAAALAVGASPSALGETYTRQFSLLLEARKTAAGGPENCDECATRDSGLCGTHKEEGREAVNDYGTLPKESSAKQTCPDCAGSRAVPAQGHEPYDEVSNGMVRCPTCAGHGQIDADEREPDERTAYERYGDSGDYYAGGDDGDAQDRHYASIKQALEEGQDPLAWLEAEDNIGGAAPEKEGGHSETADDSGSYSEVPAGGQATASRLPFAREAGGARRLYADHPSGYRAEYRGGARYHIYEGDTPVDSPAIPGYSDAMSSSEAEAHAAKFTQKKLEKHFNKWVDENGSGYSSFNHPEDEPMSYADRQRFKELDRDASRKTASGLGMPEGGMLSGAPTAGSVEEPNVPQQPQGFGGMPMAPAVDPNQSTTKPRQIPGNGPDGAGQAQTFDPAMNGSEGGPGASQDDPAPMGSEAVRREVNRRVAKVARTIREDNPDVDRREAYRMAQEVVRDYGLVVQADWSGLDFGSRDGVEDGPLTKKLKNWDPGKEESAPDGDSDDKKQGPHLPKLPGEIGEAAGGIGEAAEAVAPALLL